MQQTYGQPNYYQQQPQQFGFNPQQQPNMYSRGYNPNQGPQNVPNIGNPLTEEELKELRAMSNPRFDIRPTTIEKFQGICNHRYKENGAPALDVINGDLSNGEAICRLCGRTVRPRAYTKEEITNIVDEFVNIQEIIKFSSYGISEKVARELFGNTIPFNIKMGTLYENSMRETNSITNNMYQTQYGQYGGVSVYHQLQNNGFVPAQPMGPQYYNNMGPGFDPMYTNPVGSVPNTNVYSNQQPISYAPGQPFSGANSVMGGQQQPIQNPFYGQQGQMAPQGNYMNQPQQPVQQQQTPVQQTSVKESQV